MTMPTEERYTGLAREIRILLMSTLGSWSKVFQLVVLLLVLAASVAILIAVTRSSGQLTPQVVPARHSVTGVVLIDQPGQSRLTG